MGEGRENKLNIKLNLEQDEEGRWERIILLLESSGIFEQQNYGKVSEEPRKKD